MMAVVVSVSEFPATRQALMADLANADLVQRFLDETGGAPLVVHADLVVTTDDGGEESYRWTSSSGPPTPVHAGTLCTAQVVVREQRPVELLVPGIKDAVGL